ncbi:MAG: hypothetical protein IMZ65_03930 [Planctomycetes bacterium]|nr:hypothetical protein [Planctomycetota bacterium]
MRNLTSTCLVLAMLAMAWGATVGCAPESTKKTDAPAPALAPAKAPVANMAVSELILPTEAAAVMPKHFVMNWMVLGPFTFKDTDFGGDPQLGAAAKAFMPNEADLSGTQAAPAGAAWKAMTFVGVDEMGQADLDLLYGGIDHAAAYAVAWLDCPQDVTNAKLYVGSDDFLTVWINGKQVHSFAAERRASVRDQDIVKGITLKKGLNRVVVKCVDVVFDWNFYFRLTDSQDRPIAVKPKS